MKKRLALWVVLGLGLVMAGCFMPSVYPFYTEKDLVFDEALMGTWAAADRKPDDKENWTFAKAGATQYTFNINKEDETNVFSARLFKLKGFTFMDCLYVGDLPKGLPGIPPHYLAKVTQIEPSLKLSTLSVDWLDTYLQTNPAAIQHILVYDRPEDTNTAHFVLTADTKELQRFILKHAADTNFWADFDEMKRVDAKGGH